MTMRVIRTLLLFPFLLLALRDATAQRQARPHAQKSAPGQFDFYLLNLSWAPEYCATHPDGSAECTGNYGLVVHGMWPQNNDGSYPEQCSNAPGLPSYAAWKDIQPDYSLFAHEWTTHGTCSGLAPTAYFNMERQAYQSVKVPASLNATTQTMLSPNALLMQFQQENPGFPQGSFALSCGNNQLTAVEACFAKDGKTAIACSGLRSCKAQQIKVAPRNAGTK